MATESSQCATCASIVDVQTCRICGAYFCPNCVVNDSAGRKPAEQNEGTGIKWTTAIKNRKCSMCYDEAYCQTEFGFKATKNGIKKVFCPVNLAMSYLIGNADNVCGLYFVKCGIMGCPIVRCHVVNVKLFLEMVHACPDIPNRVKKLFHSDWRPCEENPRTMWGKPIPGSLNRTGRGCRDKNCPAQNRITNFVTEEQSRVAKVNKDLIEFNGSVSSDEQGSDKEWDPCTMGNDEAQKVVGRTFGKRGYHHLDPTNLGFTKTKTGYKRKVEFKLQKKGLENVYKVKRSSLRITETVIPKRAKRRPRKPTKLKPNKTLACYDRVISVNAAAAQVVHDIEGPDLDKDEDKHTATQWFEIYHVRELSKDWFFLNGPNEDSQLCLGKEIKVGMSFPGDSKTSYFRATVVAIYDEDDFDDFPLSHPVHKMTKSGQFTVQVWDHALLDRSFNCNGGAVCRVRTFDYEVEKEHPTVLRAREAARAHDDELRAQRAELESSQSSGSDESDGDLDGFVED